MFSYLHFSVCLFISIFLVGCNYEQVIQYIPPTKPEPITNVIVVNQSYDQVWEKLVKGINKKLYSVTFFKDDGGIFMTYTGNPEPFIDGGSLIYPYPHLFSTKRDSFPAARQDAYYTYYYNKKLVRVARSLNLVCNLQIKVTKNGSKSTKVSVDAKYQLTIQCSESKAKASDQISWDMTYETYDDIVFYTNKNGAALASGQIKVYYWPNGKLENSILELITE